MRNKEELEQIVETSKKIGVPVKSILDMLFYLTNGPVTNGELLQKVGVSQNALNVVKQELGGWLKPTSKVTELTHHTRELLNEILGDSYQHETSMWIFLQETEGYKRAIEAVTKCDELRPSPDRNLDQFTATVETTAKRAAFMHFLGDLEGKRVLFLGDDDFTSIAVSQYPNIKKIAVLDIDPRITANISKTADFETAEYDARNDLPTAHKGDYDVVFTDPPYTPEGVSLFLSRAIDALDRKGNQAARIYFCYGNSDRAKERYLPIHEMVVKSGLMLRWALDKFNRYQGAESVGSSSTLFICDVTPKTKPLITGNYAKPIYTNN